MKKFILAAVVALSMGGAHAQAYMGAGLTSTVSNISCSGMLTCTNHGAGGKVYAGYVPKSGIGGELDYVLPGTAKTSSMVSSALVSTDIESTAIAALMVFRGTVSRSFFVHAKLGFARVETTSTSRSASIVVADRTESTVHPFASLGLEYGFVESVKLVAYVDMTRGKVNGQSSSMHAAGLGVEFLF